MASKPETRFIASINRLLPLKKRKECINARNRYPDSKHIHYEKMNNPYSSGTADCWYSGKVGDCWLEYKYLPRIPQRVSVKPFELLSALQKEWLEERHSEGRTVAVIIGCPDGGVLLRDGEWNEEITPQRYASLLLSRTDLAEWILTQVAGQTTR